MVLEAQASCLPVIVTDQGGPAENMIPEKTGFVISGDCQESLFRAMKAFVNTPYLIQEMSSKARGYMENRSFRKAFLETWELFREIVPDSIPLAS